MARALSLVVVVLAAGCSWGGGGNPSGTAVAPPSRSGAETGGAARPVGWTAHDPTAPTKAETAWAQRLYGWRLELGVSQHSANGSYTSLKRCGSTLAAVGRPPTHRMVPLLRLARRACDHYRSGAIAYVRGHGTSAVGAREWATADRLIGQLEETVLLATQFSGDRSLPRRRDAIDTSHIDPLFSRVAGEIAGHTVEARCFSRADWQRLEDELRAFDNEVDEIVGFAYPDGDRIYVSAEACDPVTRFAYRGEWPDSGDDRLDLAFGLQVIVHESEHARGYGKEAVAECYAMQELRNVARRLGATRAHGAELAELYWRDVYPSDLAEYRSRECADGRALDLHKRDSTWP